MAATTHDSGPVSPPTPPSEGGEGARGRSRASVVSLAFLALGVVYGDIGTSPLYAIKECFTGSHSVERSPENVLGVLSLVFWSLTIVVSVKYLLFVMRADNRGEGGIFALLAEIPSSPSAVSPRLRAALVLAALCAAALLYGDGIITPAISVLSAVEGLSVATHAAEPVIVPLTCLILFVLFLLQRRGTGSVGKLFGPVMFVFFVTIAILGGAEIARCPSVLAAIDPRYAGEFFARNGWVGFGVLGSVVLCITGGEALYADMGHFGLGPIRLSWFTMVCPALLLNYFGQGALLLTSPKAIANPFYELAPRVLLYPMVALSTAAAIIASQAMISGAFSMTRQAAQLGFFPRVTIRHTSDATEGQIYVPEVNWAMMVGCIALVVGFGESTRLAGAYGIAVTLDMALTSVLYFFVVTRTWRWPIWRALPLVALFLFFDLSYFSANLLKLLDGGWLPLAIAVVIVTAMVTWRDGRAELRRRLEGVTVPLEVFLKDVARQKPHRVAGCAVFMTALPNDTPLVLLHHLKHNQVLHEQVVLLTVQVAERPTVSEEERLRVESVGQGFYRIFAQFGFMESPIVPQVMRLARKAGVSIEPATVSYFLGRETLLTAGPARMMRWRKALFVFLSRNAQPATAYFGLPPGRVVELGAQIDI